MPGSTELGQHLISDGPYKVDAYEPTKRIELSRNPAWNAATDPIRNAFVDKIVVNETQSQESIQQQLQTGTPNADMEFDIGTPPSQVPGLLAANDPNLMPRARRTRRNPYVVYNTASPNNNKALANVKVRQALSYAINRANIIQVLGGPDVDPPLTHVLPPGIVGSQENDPYPYDPDKAKQMLAEAGYPNGLTLKFLYRNASEGSSKTFADRAAGPARRSASRSRACRRRTPTSTPSTCRCPTSRSAASGTSRSRAGARTGTATPPLSFFNPLFSGEPSFPPIGSNFGFYDSPATNALIKQAARRDRRADRGRRCGPRPTSR